MKQRVNIHRSCTNVDPSSVAPRVLLDTCLADPLASLRTLGWAEHKLPDGMAYYHHPSKAVVTDVNLRNPANLQRTMELLDLCGPIPPSWEVWLPTAAFSAPAGQGTWGPGAPGGRPSWVNYQLRIVVQGCAPDILATFSADALANEWREEDSEYLCTRGGGECAF